MGFFNKVFEIRLPSLRMTVTARGAPTSPDARSSRRETCSSPITGATRASDEPRNGVRLPRRHRRPPRCSHCNQEGHNARTCALRDVEKGPWFQDPDDRWHTKIVDEEEWPSGPVTEYEVPCNCQFWSEGDKHYDFSDVD